MGQQGLFELRIQPLCQPGVLAPVDLTGHVQPP
jgi:hypothetical protein